MLLLPTPCSTAVAARGSASPNKQRTLGAIDLGQSQPSLSINSCFVQGPELEIWCQADGGDSVRKHRAALGVAYEAGLGVAAVTVGDSQRMLIRARQGWASTKPRRIQPPPPTDPASRKSLRLIKAIEAEEPRSSLNSRWCSRCPS